MQAAGGEGLMLPVNAGDTGVAAITMNETELLGE
jgi:hypothetical protein